MIDIVMTKEISKIGIPQTVDIGEYCSVEEYNMDRIIDIALGIIRIVEMILKEEILEEIWDQIRIIEDKTIEMEIEDITELITMKEVGEGLEKDIFQIMSEGMTDAVVVGLDQVQELVLLEIGLNVIDIESMIILQKTL